ncbi:MAG: dihydrolipoyl dehydrogenase [Deltaproteobacteria bacterium]|nr:MAG: dihydrolipoyl dehydrogenase [Deltaproteobacteria bacterium]
MKEYDLIAIGTGSAMRVVSGMIATNPDARIAVIDKDEPGGICLTKGCIPSKLLLYPADLVRTIETSTKFGIEAEVKNIDFKQVMDRMRGDIQKEIDTIRKELEADRNIDYYFNVAKFVAPYTLRVGTKELKSNMILLTTGSKPSIPTIKGLDEVSYHTSDTLLEMTELPESLVIVGGGYIAAEYGHFFSAMGSEVTIVGRNPHFLADEEPEVSTLAMRELSKHLDLLTNHEAVQVQETGDGMKKLVVQNRATGATVERFAREILVATGRGPNTDILQPERANIKTDESGWIVVDEFLETSQPNIWAFGDANGKYPFKHKANYEAFIVYNNAILQNRLGAEYHAVPHAVFTHPEVASVGLKEKEAVELYGEENVLIGFKRYQDTAKGEAMAVEDCFAKIIVEQATNRILGGHIIGPHASILIQEVITLMYTPSRSVLPIMYGMHIHPALSEVVERALDFLITPAQYHHMIDQEFGLEPV